MARVLIVEDNRDLNDLFARHLTADRHVTVQAHDLPSARLAIADGVDAVILDLMLPGGTGEALLAEIRRTSALPVIVVSAKAAVWTRVDLLRLGADDYLVKPLDLTELSARLGAVLRRTLPARPDSLTHAGITLDTGAQRVTVRGVDVALTATERAILELLLSAPDRVRSKAAIHEYLWDEPYAGDDRALKTHISHLRAKLRAADDGTEHVDTVWGLDYRLSRPDR